MNVQFNSESSSNKEVHFLSPVTDAVHQLGRDMIIYCKFCPNYVLDLQFDHRNKTTLVGVLVDIQITGVQDMIEKYTTLHENGIHKVTYTLNVFLGIVFEAITFWGGDILRNDGDRCLSFWKLSKEDTIYGVLHNVIVCSCYIQKLTVDFNHMISYDLNLKICISCGNSYSVYLGEKNLSSILRGEPILEIYRLSRLAKIGEILISSKAWAHMIKHRYHVSIIDENTIKLASCKISYKANDRALNYELCKLEMSLSTYIAVHVNFLKRMQSEELKNRTVKVTSLFRNLEQRLPPRKEVINYLLHGEASVIRPFVPQTVLNQINVHQPIDYLTKMNTITAQIIVIKTNAAECLSDTFVALIYKKINELIDGTSSWIYIFEVSVKIKIIILSGVDAVTKGTDSKNALKMSYKIHEVFQNIPGITYITLGIFNEYLYCGVVGHPFRKAFVILGLSMKKAYKILDHNKGKVICDYKTFQFSKLTSSMFRCISKKKCRLQMDTGQLMEYSELESNLLDVGKDEKSMELIGRELEVQRAIKIIFNHSKTTHGLIFSAGYNVGKTSIVKYLSEYLATDKRIILVNISIMETTNNPYSALSQLYIQLYHQLTQKNLTGLGDILSGLPPRLIDHHEYVDVREDNIDLYKYRVLQSMKTLFQLCSDQLPVILIRNINYMDTLSWDILNILLEDCNMRIVATADFSGRKLKALVDSRYFEIHDLALLPDDKMIQIACNIMGVTGIKRNMAEFIANTCHGHPGFLNNCIYYFINYEEYNLNLVHKYFIPDDCQNVGEVSSLPNQVMLLVPKASEHQDLTDKSNEFIYDTIIKGIYLALNPCEQAMIKTSAVLGPLFCRDLLSLAMFSPTKEELEDCIENFFKAGFFQCGSTFVNNIESYNGSRCLCLKTPEEIDKIKNNNVASYRFCKLLHFKDKNMLKISYNMLTGIQRRDLHMLCTEVLESSLHYCPTCLRDPVNSFMVSPKYDDIVKYCSGTELSMTVSKGIPQSALKDCILDKLFNPCQCGKQTNCIYSTPIRLGFDPNRCRCLDIQLSVFQSLAYHSKRGRHMGKQIFYLSIYGYLLIVARDVAGAISILREAFELCMVDIHSPKCQISTNYRRFSVGRICMMLACGMIQIRKINQAKGHMSIALRQYDIPLVAFRYSHLQWFFNRCYLPRLGRRQRISVGQTWTRWEVGMCFVLCSKIFALEGNLENAKHCANYSLWILKQLNERVPMLFESYCNVVNLYRYGLDLKICEKLQKYVTRELLLNYFNDRGYYAQHIITLMSVEFEMMICKGNLSKSVTLCYRIVDTTLKLFVYASLGDTAHWFSTVFGFTLRFQQFVDIMHVVIKNHSEYSTQMWYFTNALDITLLTGYSLVPMRMLLKEVNSILNYTNVDANVNWETKYILSLLYLHTIKADYSMRAAEKYKPECIFTENSMRRPYVLRVLLNLLEANLMDIYYRQVECTSYSRLQVLINQYFELASLGAKFLPIFYPRLYCLYAWWSILNHDHPKMRKFLSKAEKISKAQGNILFVYFVARLRNFWAGIQMADAYSAHINILLSDVLHLRDEQWIVALQPYPIIVERESTDSYIGSII